ncbi:MAG: hypothetical protein VW547_11375 [Alphaproteobacteria bacterium]
MRPKGRAPEKLLRGLTNNHKWGHVEIDLVEFSGPARGRLDNRLMALELVRASLARAVLFDDAGRVQIPADAIYKRSVVVLRGNFRPVTNAQVDMCANARERFAARDDVDAGSIVGIAEMTMAEPVTLETAAALTRKVE